jgi:PAS domain S-box-containing protein
MEFIMVMLSSKPEWRTTILHVIIPVVSTMVLFICAIFFLTLPAFEKNLLDSKREMIHEMTEITWGLLNQYEERVLSGELTLEEAQKRAISRISILRYGSELKDYFWINDMHPNMVMHPFRPDLDGTDITNFTDPNGKQLFVEFVKVVQKNGSGYVDYMWQWKDNPNRIVPKTSYVKGFEPWGWIIGTGIYIEDIQQKIDNITNYLYQICISIFALILLISLYIIWNNLYVEKKRIKAEKSIRYLRNLLSNVIDSMPSVLVGVDIEETIIQWNKEAEKITGISSDQAVGQQVSDVMPMITKEISRITQLIKDREIKKHRISIQSDEINNKISDITVYPLIGNGIEGAVIRIDDVTEQVAIEEIMIQSEKMLSVGGLAAGMAHEINNPLAGIMQNIQVIQNRLSCELPKNRKIAEECGASIEIINDYINRREIHSMITAVIDSGRRAAEIVENMLSFSRKSSSEFIRHKISSLLDKTIEIAYNDYDLKKKYDFRKIIISKDYDESLPMVKCDGNKIQQVFLNLLKNAAQSMSDGEEQQAPPQINIRLFKKDGFISIEIEDNGPGMTENIRKRIFEPFFTTKEIGEGTGLGLSVSYFIIVKNHNGVMKVQSSPGKGAKFIIELELDDY